MTVTETFFRLEVGEMDRAITFYVAAFGATAPFTSPRWTSLFVCGVRIGLFASPGFIGARVGLHFVVTDLSEACAAVEQAGGSIVRPPIEVAPGVVVVEVRDTEGNVLALRQA